MDNMYEPPGGDPAEGSRPTEQFWPTRAGAGGHPNPRHPNPGHPNPGHPNPGYRNRGYQDPRYQAPPASPGQGPRRRNSLHWAVGLVAAGALAIGGIVAGVSLAGHSSPAASTAAGPSAQAAALNSALNSAGAPGTLSLTSSPAAAGVAAGSAGAAAVAHPCARALKAARAARQAGHAAVARAALRAVGARCLGWRHRLVRRALLRGIDGQFTFRGKGGIIRTLAFERGTVQSVSGGVVVVVRASDGTTWTWVLGSESVVRESGRKTTASAVAAGEPVWVGGPVVSGAKDARLVVIRPPSAPSSSSSPSPAPSASSSTAGS